MRRIHRKGFTTGKPPGRPRGTDFRVTYSIIARCTTKDARDVMRNELERIADRGRKARLTGLKRKAIASGKF